MSRHTAKQAYESQMSHLLGRVWEREGETLTFNPVDLNTPLSSVIDGEASSACAELEDLPHDQRSLGKMSWEELLSAAIDLKTQCDEARQQTLSALLNFLFGGGPEPVNVAERAFVLARTVSQTHVWNMRQNEAAAAFGLIRQTWQEMEARLIEELARRYSSTPFTTSGGKSHSARARYARDKKGNTSRRFGRKRGDTAR